MLKQIMIPVAAFAVTVSAASAFNPDMLDQIEVDLSDTQVAALEQAHEMKEAGAERAEVKEVLEEAGVDQDTIKEIKTAVKEVRTETKEAVKAAVEAEDYDAFAAAAPDKLTDAIDSEADFALFVEAAELREAGDKEGAAEIMSDLGIEKPEREGRGEGRGGKGKRGGDRDEA